MKKSLTTEEKSAASLAEYYDDRKDVDLAEDEETPICFVQVPLELLPTVRQLLSAFSAAKATPLAGDMIDRAKAQDFKSLAKDLKPEASSKDLNPNDLKAALTSRLAREERLLVILYYFYEMSLPEIAATLDRTTDSVKALHQRVLEKLREAVVARRSRK